VVEFRLELVTPRQRRAIVLGMVAVAILAASSLVWIWPLLPRPYVVPPPGPVIVLAAQFDTAESGWVALRSGSGPLAPTGIYRTDDAGRTWHPLPVPVRTPAAASIHFFDGRAGVLQLVRDESDGRTALYGTADGGGSWEARSLPRSRNGQATLFFADPLNGFEVFRPSGSALTLVSRTADGGRSWQDPAMTGLPSPRIGVGFIDARTGFAVAGNMIYRTADAGDTWAPVPTPPVVGPMVTASPPLAFGETVLITIDLWTAVSHDRGRSFAEARQVPFDIAKDAGISCVDSSHCRASAGPNYVVTDDGGTNWVAREAHLPNGEVLGPVHAVDPNTSWSVVATARSQQVLMTRDGGSTWRAVPLPRI
jgi:photosystem II stability/assembly factor-like uncharacterized protein